MFETEYIPPVAPIFNIRVCINRRLNTDNLPNCAGRGSRELADQLEKRISDERLPVKVVRGPCMNNCAVGPNLKIQGGEMLNLNCDVSDERFELVIDSIKSEVAKRQAEATAAPSAP